MDIRLFMEDIAKGAGDITLKYFRNPELEVLTKNDESPVTRADRESEEYLRKRIREHFPNDRILGEEYGEEGNDHSRRWILDPLDGTKSFVHGVPLYGVLIAYEQDDKITHGIAHFPALNETVSAGIGEGCFWNGRRAHVSQKALADGLVCTTSPIRLEELIGRKKYDRITRAFSIYRGWGDCYGHILVATGRAEAMLDARMALWDSAPLGVIVSEAGGKYFDFSGAVRIDGGNLASCAPGVADDVLKMLIHD